MSPLTIAPGLEGIVTGDSAICLIDQEKGSLAYRGYAIEDLAESASFEEVAYLLLHEDLPTGQEDQDWRHDLQEHRQVPESVIPLLSALPRTIHPMDFLRTGISLLGSTDPEAMETSHPANVRKATRLIAQLPVLLQWAIRFSHPHTPPPDMSQYSYAENLLYTVTGSRNAGYAKELEVSLILYAEHELNASTFAARVVASTMADMYGAVTAAIAALKGPLHGGANESVARMLTTIGQPHKAKDWIHGALARKERIMGFGHRVLKHEDPRSAIMKRRARSLSHAINNTKWYELAEVLEETMRHEKNLLPNLDFYTAVVYLLLRIPIQLFTPIFVLSRITGWSAHIIEQQDHNRLIRPRAAYTGPKRKEFLPLACRSIDPTFSPAANPPE